MLISIIAVGKAGKGPEKEIISSYLKRTPWNITIKEVEEKKPLPRERLMAREADLLLAATPKDSIKIILDERGKNLSSVDFAHKFSGWMEQARPISFFIGGADGHGEILKEQADFALSLGNMTWPHMLARTMLAEQLYRVYSILNSHPYHRA